MAVLQARNERLQEVGWVRPGPSATHSKAGILIEFYMIPKTAFSHHATRPLQDATQLWTHIASEVTWIGVAVLEVISFLKRPAQSRAAQSEPGSQAAPRIWGCRSVLVFIWLHPRGMKELGLKLVWLLTIFFSSYVVLCLWKMPPAHIMTNFNVSCSC